MSSCEQIEINSFNTILEPINLKELRKLSFYGHKPSFKIQPICDYAFYECDRLEYINLSENNIKYISANAFNFKSNKDEILEIDLSNNTLNGFKKFVQ